MFSNSFRIFTICIIAFLAAAAKAGQSGLLLGVASPAVSCSASTTFIARTTGLSASEQNAVATFICALANTSVTTSGLSGSLLSNTCAAYFFATNNTTTAGLNVVSSSDTITVHGSPTFTTDVGWAGDSSAAFLDTGLLPSACGSQNNQGMSALVQTNRTTNNSSALMGAGQSGEFSVLNALNVQYDINDATFPTFTNSTTKGGFTVSRTGSSSLAVYLNGSSTAAATSTAASVGVPSVSFWIFGVDNAGSLSNASSDQISCVGIHAGFNGTDSAAWQNACNTGLAIIGRSVY